MGTGVSPTAWSLGILKEQQLHSFNIIKSGQADQQISIFKLKQLLALHLRPINLVVYKVLMSPKGRDIYSWGELGT